MKTERYLCLFIIAITVSCARLPERTLKGETKNRFLGHTSICYELFIKENGIFKKYDATLCSNQYPEVSEGDGVSVEEFSDGKREITLDKLKTFEDFFASLKDPKALNYYSFLYFNDRNLIEREKYRLEWTKLCQSNGFYCRLLAYLEKSEGNEKNFFPNMERGCQDKDILSCFNIIARREDLSNTAKIKIKRDIRSECLKVKNTDYYQDFCGVLLEE